jgi:PTS system mannose-specific IIA component
MIGILIVTHGDFGRELLKSAELIVGKQEKVKTLSLKRGDNIESLYSSVNKDIGLLDDGEGVLVLTDLFGGSPSNVTAANMKETYFESLSGVNLPMLIEALNTRVNEISLKELTNKVYKVGIDGIKNIRCELHITDDSI